MKTLFWLQPVYQSLIKRHNQNTLAHGLMLKGSFGMGKKALATSLANAFLCSKRLSDQTACGECKNCWLFLAGNHPDYLIIADNNGTIKIDQIRSVNQFLRQTATGCQVVVLSLAESLNEYAANALLKTLEEPSGHCYIILLSECVESVVATIRSRVEKVSLNRPSSQNSLAWLQNQGISLEDAKKALSVNEWIPIRAKDWLQNDGINKRIYSMQCMKNYLSHEISFTDTVQTLASFDHQTLMIDWLLWVSDLIKMRMGMSSLELDKKESVFFKLFHASPLASLFRFYQRLQMTFIELNSHQVILNEKLLIETLLLDWKALLNGSHLSA